jgi:DNA-binding transcriptional MocR family regulator
MQYQMVIDYIEACIKNNIYKAGTKLPSVRVLAQELNCSKSTVVKAYEVFVENRLAYVIDKSGYYLMQDPGKMLLSDKIYFNQRVFRPALLDENKLQFHFNQMMNKSGIDKDFIKGDFDLRTSLKSYYKNNHLFTRSQRILVTSHLKEAFHIILETILSEKDKILVENPSHPQVIEFFKNHPKAEIFNRVNRFDFNLLELYFIQKNIKIFIIQGEESFLYEKTLSLEDKRKLLNLCQLYDVYLVDLDFSSEGRSYENIQSLFSLDREERVIHIKTFNQYFSEVLKIASVIMPSNFVDKAAKHKEKYYGQSSYIEQGVLNQYLSTEAYTLGKKKCEEKIKKRYKIFESIYQVYKDEIAYVFSLNDEKSHIFLSVESSFDFNTMKLDLDAMNIKPGLCHEYYFNEPLKYGFMISLTYHDSKTIRRGLEDLFQYLKNKGGYYGD